MTEHDSLYRAVLDHPEDDTVRLVYADYLDENPTPKRKARAEFIRLQVAWERNRNALIDAGRASDSVGRQAALLRKWGMGWLPSGKRHAWHENWAVDASRVVTTWTIGATWSWLFERGFLARVRVELAEGPPDGNWPFVRAAFAAAPLEAFVVAVAGFDPEVRVEIAPARAGGAWVAEAWADNLPQDFGRRRIASTRYGVNIAGSRAELGRDLPSLLEHALEQVEFHPSPVEIPF